MKTFRFFCRRNVMRKPSDLWMERAFCHPDKLIIFKFGVFTMFCCFIRNNALCVCERDTQRGGEEGERSWRGGELHTERGRGGAAGDAGAATFLTTLREGHWGRSWSEIQMPSGPSEGQINTHSELCSAPRSAGPNITHVLWLLDEILELRLTVSGTLYLLVL